MMIEPMYPTEAGAELAAADAELAIKIVDQKIAEHLQAIEELKAIGERQHMYLQAARERLGINSLGATS